MVMSPHHDAGQNRNLNIANKSFENVEKVKYLWTIITNQISISEEIQSRLNSGNNC
jgi:hypothetical protein